MASVTLSDIRKSYGDVEVIHGIDLDVQDGEFVALVGPSGCGKSTLLRMIAGLDHPTTGDIAIAGTRVNTFTPKERNIAMVFQNYALYPHMTVDQNISFNLRLSGLPKDEIKRRVDEAARMLDLTGLLDRRPSQLSGGQRQRVAMGRAVVRDPAVFLFDEPLSNLDAKLRVQMRGEIKVLHEKVGTTAIYVTHDQIEAMTLADRIVVLNKGRVEQQGSPLELYRRPQNMFVAGFIGSPAMNFIPCTLADVNGGTELVFEGGERLSLSGRFGVSGQRVVLGARPEHLQLSQSTPGALNGTVRLLEPTGAQMHLVVEAMGQALTVVTDGDSVITAGEAVGLTIAEERIHLFDAQTSLRVDYQR